MFAVYEITQSYILESGSGLEFDLSPYLSKVELGLIKLKGLDWTYVTVIWCLHDSPNVQH